jgi:protein-disulfide isomerase
LSNGTSGDSRLTKNEKREAAREKARILREEQKKKDRRTKILVQGGVILASLAIIAVVAVVIVNSIRPAGPGPANMASDGIQLTQGFIATETPALQSDEEPVPNVRDEAAGTLDIQMYVDYLCPICGQFEETNGEYIGSLVENGNVTLEIHPISILDRLSQGTKYSTRAVNATACFANYEPNLFYDFHNALFANQPAENTTGLSDDELIILAEGVGGGANIAECIRSQEFKGWAAASTTRALNGPIPNSNIEQVVGTPTVLVNGLKYEGPVNDLASFQAFVIQAAGADFVANSTPTPTPTPTP